MAHEETEHEGSTGQPLLILRGLSMRFGSRQVLQGLDLELGRGEIFGLLGPNGSGKSTTFGILTGLLRPEAGTVVFDGVETEPGSAALRRRMGVVFQRPSLDPNLSCRENLKLAAALHCVPRGEVKSRADALLDFAELTDRADERVKTLSGGMRRRLELARALMHAPDLLVMDEPTTGLDEASFQRTWERLRALRAERGLTVLLSSHRPEEAAQCDRLALMDAGKVVACDTPDALQRRISGDIIMLHGRAPAELADVLRQRFELEPQLVEGGVEITAEHGHELIPRLVEAFPNGRLRAVTMKRPSLADVFLQMTGHALLAEDEREAGVRSPGN